VNRRQLRAAVKAALHLERVPGRPEVSLVLTEDEFIRELNRLYRHRDEPTDVLSFSQDEGDGDLPVAGPRLLGDVVISVETAARQAATAHRSLDAELAELAVHGTLHLLGWEDETPGERDRMLARQADILAAAAAGETSG